MNVEDAAVPVRLWLQGSYRIGTNMGYR